MLNRTILLYLVSVSLVGFTVDGGIYSVILNLFLLRLGYGPAFIGFVSAIGQLTFALFSIPAGLYGVRHGNRRVMFWGLVVTLIACITIPSAEFIPESFRSGWLLVAYILLYLGLALFFVNAPPYLIALVGPERRDQAFSYQVALWATAGFAGSLLGGLIPGWTATALNLTLADPTPYRYPLMLAAVMIVPALVVLWLIPEVRPLPAANRPQKQGGDLPRNSMVTLALIRMLQVGSMGAISPFFNVYMDTVLQVPTAQIGLITSLGRLLSAPAALVTPWFAKRWGNAQVVIWVTVITSVCIVPLALIPHWLAAGFGFITMIGLSSIRYAAFVLYSLSIVPPRVRPTVNGIQEMAAGASFTITSLVGGQLITLFGYAPLFLSGSVMGLLGTFLFSVYLSMWQPPPIEEVETSSST